MKLSHLIVLCFNSFRLWRSSRIISNNFGSVNSESSFFFNSFGSVNKFWVEIYPKAGLEGFFSCSNAFYFLIDKIESFLAEGKWIGFSDFKGDFMGDFENELIEDFLRIFFDYLIGDYSFGISSSG